MSEEQKDFSDDDEKIVLAVARFKEAMASGEVVYFDVDEYEGIIDYLMEDAEVELAKAAIEHAMDLHPNSFDIKIKKAQLLVFEGKAVHALELISELEGMKEENVDISLAKGAAYIQMGDIAKAVEIYQQVFDKNGDDDGELAYDIGLSLQQAEEFEQAIPYLEKAYENNPLESILYELGYCYSRILNYAKGAEYYKQFLDIDPFNAAVWYNLGINYNQLGESVLAIEAYDYAIALQEDLDQAYFNKANVLANMGNNEEAIKNYAQYLEMCPNSEDGNFYIADCYFELEDIEKACNYYNKAFEINPKNTEALHKIAIALMSDDRNEAALKVILEAINIEQDNALFWTTYASLLLEMDMTEEAKTAFNRAIEIDEASVIAWAGLSVIALENENADKALEILQQAEQINPDNVYILSKLAILHLKQDRIEQADAKFKEAIETDQTLLLSLLSAQNYDAEEQKKIDQIIDKYKTDK